MRHLAVIRILAALPLVVIGAMHLVGAAPMLPILEGAGMPLPELSARVAPVVEVVAGLLLLTGFQVRLGALLAMVTMGGALFAHLRYDWEDEPPIAIPMFVMLGATWVFARGAGRLVRRDGGRDPETGARRARTGSAR